MPAVSLDSALAARIVLTAESARSTEAAMSPTRCCAFVVADLICLAETTMEATATEIIPRVSSSKNGSMKAMAMIAPTKMSTPPAASISP